MSSIVREDLRLVGSLRDAAKQYVELKKDRAETAVKLYETFLKDYIFRFEKDKRKIADFLKVFFGKNKIRIVAVDGTSYSKSRRGCLVFYVLAAPLVYEVDLVSSKLRPVRVEEETVKNNVMALIPVPLSEIFLLSEETVPLKEEEETREELGDVFSPQKIGKIDTVIMKLAEVYTVYWVLKNIKPEVIMMDGSLFQSYSFSNRSVEKLSMYKGEILGRKLFKDDFILLKSLPIDSALNIPSVAFTREFLTGEILVFGKIELDKNLSFRSRLIDKDVAITRRQLTNLKELDYLKISEEKDKVTIALKSSYEDGWTRLKDLFLAVCKEGFGKNNLDAFRVYITENGKKSYRYLCEEDIETLCRIGYNLIFEECWKTGTLLFSVTKDSFVRFFVDNFLTIGGPKHLKLFDFDQELLPRIPSTDAGMIYDISVRIDNFHAPIALMEYDPAISTIYSFYDAKNKEYILRQLRKVAQERQFLRSLVQLFEDETTRRKSYVYTVDRITYPKFDNNFKKMVIQMGKKSYEFAYYDEPNDVLKAIVGLMYLVSSNKHDAVFGYPDPLFEVDQYVKTLGRAHLETLDLALTEIDLDEFSVTYRQMRKMGGG
jgi:hypothetical protein